MRISLYHAQRLLKLAVKCVMVYIIFFLAAFFIYYPVEQGPRNFSAPKALPADRRVSKLGICNQTYNDDLECSNFPHHSCLIHNLYHLGGELHVYLGSDFNLTESYTQLRDMRVITGMGFGSHIFRFELDIPKEKSLNLAVEQVDSEDFDESDLDMNSSSIPTKTWSILNDTAREYLIYTHFLDPPKFLSATKIIVEPTSFFSVLWPNLFRTMYAGTTLLRYL